MKLFIVYTDHSDYDEYDPFIVLALNEEDAKCIVLNSDEFKDDGEGEVLNVCEVSLKKADCVWAVYNAG